VTALTGGTTISSATATRNAFTAILLVLPPELHTKVQELPEQAVAKAC
jgi:hypothetical protein